MRKSTEDRRCVRCERLLFFWHPIDKPLCTTCSPHQGPAAPKRGRQARLKAGGCARCGKPRAPGHKSFCEAHREAHCRYVRQSAYRRYHNLCTICGEPKPSTHWHTIQPRCPACSRKGEKK